MRTLTYTTPQSSGDCPPEDVYTLRIAEVGEFSERTAWKNNPDDPDVVNTQSRIEFEIVDWDYDPDADDRDWNGQRIADYFVFLKTMPDGKVRETWKDERSTANTLIRAVLRRDLEENEEVDLGEFVGDRVRATVKPKASGYPKITDFLPARKRKRAQPALVADEDFDPFKEDGA